MVIESLVEEKDAPEAIEEKEKKTCPRRLGS